MLIHSCFDIRFLQTRLKNILFCVKLEKKSWLLNKSSKYVQGLQTHGGTHGPHRKTLMIVSRLRIQKWQSCTNRFKIREFLLNLLRQIKV